MLAFPGLCEYYDQFFYSNNDLSAAVQREDEIVLLATQSSFSMDNWTAFDTVEVRKI